MVTVLREHGLRFVIYTADHEPPHVHVYGDGEARIDMASLKVMTQGGMSDRDVRRAVIPLRPIGIAFSKSGGDTMADVSDAELAEAKARWQTERAGRPIPVSVRYDGKSGRIVVDFENGAAFMIPSRALEGLQEATEAELAEVELLGETGLHWETLDVDYTITGLMSGIFGSRSFMDAQRRGGLSRSPAKAAASRRNGSKGGRPRKVEKTTAQD